LRDEYVRAGMSFAAPGVRVDRLEEAIHVLKALFDGRPVSFAGQHYHIADLESFPRPVARPRPPLLIGAGSKRMLQISGREADIVNILPKALPNGTISEELSERTPETTKQKIAWIRAGAGERFDEIELSALISPLISDDARDAAAQFASARGWGGHAAEQVLDMPSAFVGPVERIIDLMHERREVYGFSYYIVSDRAIDTFAPIVAKLTGA
jgi:probable F420-dependent oxidoreductase